MGRPKAKNTVAFLLAKYDKISTPTAEVIFSKEETAQAAFDAIKAIVRRAIMTLITLRDPDRKYHHKQSSWLFPVVNQANESYGYAAYGFEPTPHDISQMEVIAGWLAWLRRTEGEAAIRRIIAWTLGVPAWRLGTRERCSERTIRNRIDRSIAAMIRQFAAVDLSIEVVEDLKVATPYSMVMEQAPGPHGGPVLLRKVYIYDTGFMIGSKQWRDGREKAEKFCA